MTQYTQTQNTKTQPSLNEQGVGQQDSPKRTASETYSATEQQRDKAKLDLTTNTAAPLNGGREQQPTVPDEVPQKDDRPERYPAEDRQAQDAEANRRS